MYMMASHYHDHPVAWTGVLPSKFMKIRQRMVILPCAHFTVKALLNPCSKPGNASRSLNFFSQAQQARDQLGWASALFVFTKANDLARIGNRLDRQAQALQLLD
jgi:hypothetical protein